MKVKLEEFSLNWLISNDKIELLIDVTLMLYYNSNMIAEDPFSQPKNQLIRQTITPTYIHHNIFSNDPSCQHLNVRFTPTFASTIFQAEADYSQTMRNNQEKLMQKDTVTRLEPCIYTNRTKQRRQADLYPCSSYQSGFNGRYQEDPKNKIMEEINFMGGRTSRMRKMVEQVSNPIFGSGYFWQPINQRAAETDKIYSPENYSRPKQIKSAQKQGREVQFYKQSVKQDKQPASQIPNFKQVKAQVIEQRPPKIKITPAKPKPQQRQLARFKSATNLKAKTVKPGTFKK